MILKPDHKKKTESLFDLKEGAHLVVPSIVMVTAVLVSSSVRVVSGRRREASDLQQ